MPRSGDYGSRGRQNITQKNIDANGDVIGQNIHVDQVNIIHPDNRSWSDQLARSAYLEQVRALAPSYLEDRERELQTLAAFCTSESAVGSYLWWRAEAWSGKSALLSWFVLHPPAGTRVVSFFVTSSLPYQNNRHSFVESVTEQLYDMVQETPPVNLTDVNRETHFRRLLTWIGERVRQRGEHFTLVVDGLDEDRGVDGSADAYSIASLLPKEGIRVVVASRPLPELPDDVRDDHPLRKSAVVADLSPSRKAAAVRDTMIRDLKRLRSGTSAQQDILGFMAVTGGGLSVQDLAQLAEISEWQVEDELRTTAGRSFTLRPGDPPVYVMAHDKLLELVREMLGPRLDAYRRSLHEWAETYRAHNWPPETPRYLLQGYTAALIEATDIPRLLTYITDPRRQDLVSAWTGHDGAALSEIKSAQKLLLNQEQPDLIALARLAVHRTSLYLRNDWIHIDLPSSWAEVGQYGRAKSLATAIGDLVKRSRALTSMAAELHRAGEDSQAAELLDEAEDLAGSFNQFFGATPLVELAEAAQRIDDDERARRSINAIKNKYERAAACASLALITFGAGKENDAEGWYRKAEEVLSDQDDLDEVILLAWVAAAAEKLGYASRAAVLVDLLLENLPDSSLRMLSKGRAAEKLAGSGLTHAACALAATISDVDSRENALLNVTKVVARRDLDEAEDLARSASDARYLCARLAGVGFEAVRGGDRRRAERLIAEVEELQAESPQDQWRKFSIMATAVAHVHMGFVERAESVVRREILPLGHVGGILAVASSLVRCDDPERASCLIELAEERARAETVRFDERRLLRWVSVMADFGEIERAEQLVQSFRTDEARSAGLTILSEGLLVDEDVDRAEKYLLSIRDPRFQRRPLLELLRVLLAQRKDERAVELARAAVSGQDRAESLTFVAGMTRSPGLLDEVIGIAEEVTEHKVRVEILESALKVAVNLGDRRRAKALLQQVQSVDEAAGQSRSLRLYPERLRTLTEIADKISRLPGKHVFTNPVSAAMGGAPLLWWPGKGLPKHVDLAYDLATNDWFDRVDDLLRAPNTFAILV